MTRLSEEEFYEKVYGGWLGKNIGGTLGVPMEGKKELLDLTFYPVLPDEPLENDDLDMQLVWLHALEQYGARLTAKELGQEWVEHIFFPFDEYGYALGNLRRGLPAPLSGSFNNPFNDCMGSPIRSEIWAMVAPNRPDVAAYYAYQDAIVDHAGGEGVFGEMFFAAIEAAAFSESDRDRLIAIGLSMIPEDCRTSLAVRDLIRWHGEGVDWKEARELILKHHGRDNFTDAPQNIAFTILGWLYGENFGDALLKATNCGYDTDCTAATLGAILGIIGGRASLPAEWVEPVGDRVVVSPPVKGFPAPTNLDELTRRTIRMSREVLAVWEDRTIRLEDYEIAPTAVRYLLPQGSSEPQGLSVTVDYGAEGPSIGAGQRKSIRIAVSNRSREPWSGTLELAVPQDWPAVPERPFALAVGETCEWEAEVEAGAIVRPTYALQLNVHRNHDRVVWSTEHIPLALAAATHWRIAGPGTPDGKDVVFPGHQLRLAEASGDEALGTYRASTKLIIPTARDVKLIVGTTAPVVARLNGEVVLDNAEPAENMPAFHRAAHNRCVYVNLAAGEHTLDLEFRIEGNPADEDIFVLPVSPEQSSLPGGTYLYSDIVFAKK